MGGANVNKMSGCLKTANVMGISHVNRLCFLFLEFLGANEALFCNFLCCTAAFGPYLVTNRKVLILHEHGIDHSKIFNGGAAAHTVLTELDDEKLSSRGVALIKSTASYIFLGFFISLKVF